MTTLYALRRTAADTYSMAKFDKDFTVEATYTLVAKGHSFTCDCPANYRVKTKPCKHQKMMPYMMGACNVPRFFDPEKGQWHDLLEVAPGMEMEHKDGEGAVTERMAASGHIEEIPRQGSPETDTEGSSGQLSDRRPYKGAAVALEGQMNGEPVAIAPAIEQVAQTQPERSVAPASAAPVVRRRI